MAGQRRGPQRLTDRASVRARSLASSTAAGALMLLVTGCEKHHSEAYWAALTARATAPCECAKLSATVDAYHLKDEVARALTQCRAKAEAITVPNESSETLGGDLAASDRARDRELQEVHTKCQTRWSQAAHQVVP